VDRFQGMERNIVIVSMVRSNIIQSSKDQKPDRKRYPEYGYPMQKSLGFAQSPNRLNVALSRAKRLLIIVGNRDLFSQLEIYQRLFMTIESNKNNNIVNQEDV
jgi:superfamily I DNA and/or RNA helicase